jgi:hypothetical protein
VPPGTPLGPEVVAVDEDDVEALRRQAFAQCLVVAGAGLPRDEHDDAAGAAALRREFLLRGERVLRVRGGAEQAGGGEEGAEQWLHRRARRSDEHAGARAC